MSIRKLYLFSGIVLVGLPSAGCASGSEQPAIRGVAGGPTAGATAVGGGGAGGSSNVSGASNGGTVSGGTGGVGTSGGGVGGSGAGGGGTGGTGGTSTGGGGTGGGGTGGTSGGSGGSGGNGGSGGTPVVCGPVEPSAADCTAWTAATPLSVSDFEGGQGWFLFKNPADLGGTTTPAAGTNITPDQLLCPVGGRCGVSSYAMHLTGMGFTSYGPSLSNDFYYKDMGTGMTVGQPQDASMYLGVAFWARLGDTLGVSPTLRVIVNDVTSHELGGVCDPLAAPGMGSAACWNGWMTETPLTTKWALFKVPFSTLKQGDFGKLGTAIQPDKLYGLTFQMPAGASFDFWIDDVAFYK